MCVCVRAVFLYYILLYYVGTRVFCRRRRLGRRRPLVTRVVFFFSGKSRARNIRQRCLVPSSCEKN